MEHTLLLNATYEPLQIVSWKRAVRMLFQDKVEVIEEYHNEVRSVSISIRIPSVIRLLHYVRVHRNHRTVKLSRSNLFLRDKYRCQYCGRQLPASELTCDHLVPVSRGGRKTWENVVTCCVPCNRRKGNRTPRESGLKLLKQPTVPAGFPARLYFVMTRTKAPDCWHDYTFSLARRPELPGKLNHGGTKYTEPEFEPPRREDTKNQ